MTKNIDVAVVCPYLKALEPHTIPPVQNLSDLILWRIRFSREREAEWAFVGAVSRIAFYEQLQAHRHRSAFHLFGCMGKQKGRGFVGRAMSSALD
jgi:hypothetical protein